VIRALATAGLLIVSALPLTAAKRPQDAAASSQQAQSPAPATSPSPAPSSARPKPKKVWTNDNIADGGGAISVIGTARAPSKADTKAAADKPVDPKVVQNLRDQLQKLQAGLKIVDQQLSDLIALSKGEAKPASGVRSNLAGYDTSSVDEQIRRLRDEKAKIQGSIDDIFDAARAAGIEPGQLR
jgi:hypothetical protein